MSVREIDARKLVSKLAEELKKYGNIKPHPYSGFVKSGVSAERPPQQQDFWYLRSAALLRKLYIKGPLGTERLRNMFGGKRRRGHKPAHHRKAGGKFIRMMLQQLEKEDLITQNKKKKGRSVTPKGQKLLESATKGLK